MAPDMEKNNEREGAVILPKQWTSSSSSLCCSTSQIVGYGWADILFSPSAPLALRRRDPQPQARVLLPPHQGGRAGDACGRGTIDAVEPERAVPQHDQRHRGPAFGKKRKNAPEFMATIKAGVRLLRGIHKTVDAILQEIIEERRCVRGEKIMNGAADDQNAEENLVDVLISLQEKGGFGFLHLDDNKIKAIILDMFVGGTGTSGFKPERFDDGVIDFMGGNYEFIPFNFSRRMCPGFNYSLVSMELALVSMLYHFDWSLPEGVKEVDMEEASGLGARRCCSVPPRSFRPPSPPIN
uniref:Cytochrome P450 n=1 Tax=Oryza punctata TaxID=4537 RepID=A0A0E0KIV7_ORYPU